MLSILALLAAPGFASEPMIENATARQTGDSWSFSVTLRHPDTGWDHYADGWRVETPDGAELGLRVLHHPHVQEQPFTRSLSGVTLPESLDKVHIRARDNVHGWGAQVFVLPLK